MNKLFKGREAFLSGRCNKHDYIGKMDDIHSILFEYSEYIGGTNISSIEIVDEDVIMTFRDSGIRFKCVKHDSRLAPIDMLNFGTYEKAELSMQLKMIGEYDTVLDVGGNFGWYAMSVAKHRSHSHVFCFEPVPKSYSYLNENIKLNNLSNISTFDFGFSDIEGSFDFYYDPTLSVNASLANTSGNKETERVVCNVRRLDDFRKEHSDKVDFIKCDVEGAELFVFKGGADLIKNDCPIVFAEMLIKWSAKFNYHPNDIISFFSELGYLCFTLCGENLKPVITVDENTIETNFFFLHKEKHSSHIKKFNIN